MEFIINQIFKLSDDEQIFQIKEMLIDDIGRSIILGTTILSDHIKNNTILSTMAMNILCNQIRKCSEECIEFIKDIIRAGNVNASGLDLSKKETNKILKMDKELAKMFIDNGYVNISDLTPEVSAEFDYVETYIKNNINDDDKMIDIISIIYDTSKRVPKLYDFSFFTNDDLSRFMILLRKVCIDEEPSILSSKLKMSLFRCDLGREDVNFLFSYPMLKCYTTHLNVLCNNFGYFCTEVISHMFDECAENSVFKYLGNCSNVVISLEEIIDKYFNSDKKEEFGPYFVKNMNTFFIKSQFQICNNLGHCKHVNTYKEIIINMNDEDLSLLTIKTMEILNVYDILSQEKLEKLVIKFQKMENVNDIPKQIRTNIKFLPKLCNEKPLNYVIKILSLGVFETSVISEILDPFLLDDIYNLIFSIITRSTENSQQIILSDEFLIKLSQIYTRMEENFTKRMVNRLIKSLENVVDISNVAPGNKNYDTHMDIIEYKNIPIIKVASVTKELKMQAVGGKPICSVCFTNELDGVYVGCGHSFCRECIKRTNEVCPICRNKSKSIQLFIN